jgi:hypothetical protein
MSTVAYALLRAASRLVSTPVESSTGIDLSADAARVRHQLYINGVFETAAAFTMPPRS